MKLDNLNGNYFLKVISLFSGEVKSILSIVIYSMTSGILLLAIPIAVQALVNTIARGGLQQQLIVLSSILLIVLVFFAVLNLIQIYIAEKLKRRLAVRIALTLAYIIPKEKFDSSINVSDPKNINRFMEVFSVQKTAGSLLLDGSLIVFQVFFGLILMAFYHPFFLIFSMLLLFSLYIIVLLVGKNGVVTAIKESTAKYEVLGWLEDIAAYPLTFKAINSDKFAINKTDELLLNYISNRVKHFRITFSQQVLTLLIQAIISALLLALGGYLVIKNELSLGQLVAAELILSVILSGMTKLIKYTHEYYSLVASIDKLDFLVDSELEDDSIKIKSDNNFRIEFHNAKVVSKNRDLEIGNIIIEQGEKVVLYGENNSGKSLIANCLFGLFPLSDGKLLIGENRIEDLSLEHLRTNIHLVRGIEIFDGTLLENILLSNKDYNMPDLRKLLKNLKLEVIIDSLKDNIHTKIDSKNNILAKSTILKIMIARAMASKPKVIILDEIFDSFDSEDSKDLINFLLNDKSFTLIITTHNNLSNFNFDLNLRIKNEKIIKDN